MPDGSTAPASSSSSGVAARSAPVAPVAPAAVAVVAVVVVVVVVVRPVAVMRLPPPGSCGRRTGRRPSACPRTRRPVRPR
ncbi:hypothetical protein ACFU6K_13755 [Kitasatospora sp. NPDC057512]|uniref:hypothetical protein n=1 Tax=Kitasatospora sp. NPDC057512 TaxID=3346154 RepID=UPI0036BC1BE6